MLNLALLVLAAAARPGEIPPAAAVFSQGPDVAGRVEMQLVKALRKKGVPLADQDSLFPPPAAESGDEGTASFAKGREAYDNLDFDAAIKALTEAAVFFIKHPSAAKADQLSEIFLFLAASELQNGAKADAAKDFTRALQMNPGLAPDKKYFGADVQGAFNAAQKEMTTRPKGKLKVTTFPGGAEVFAFGLNYGMSPVAEVELPAGRFMVQLTRPGYAPTAAFPEVVAKQTVEVTQMLTPAPMLKVTIDKAQKLISTKSFADDSAPPAALEVGKAMGSRYLVLVLVTGDAAAPKGELQVWNVTTGDRLKGVKFDGTLEGGGYDTAADAVAAWINRPGPVAGAEIEDSAQPSEGGPVFKKWWFWAGVGAVVAGGVTAGVVAAQPAHTGFNPALGQP